MLGNILFFSAIIIPIVIIAALTQPEKKRGCGRGCATCGNYPVCHGTGKYSNVKLDAEAEADKAVVRNPQN